ncbi:aldehyde dehydrogenase family protein [Caballeronia sp. LZ029]|nr:aldehyde dehydrogenase family protein [Caballeronia sp. LZ029]MDR5748883.1 aldehyde dehydrogenase family protein [Caballeronia sp. LZ029]
MGVALLLPGFHDLGAAGARSIASKYHDSGQTCVCRNRFFIHDKVHGTFTDKHAQAVDGGQVPRFSGGIVCRRRSMGRTIQLAEGVIAL